MSKTRIVPMYDEEEGIYLVVMEPPYETPTEVPLSREEAALLVLELSELLSRGEK